MKIPKKKIEKAFNKLFTSDDSCIGIDTASRTGWASIKIEKNDCILDFGYIDVGSTDRNFKLGRYTTIFNGMPYYDKVVIEDTYFSRNARVFSLLSRIGAIAFAMFYLKKPKEIKFFTAVQARKYLGLRSNVKKEEVHKQFKEHLDIHIEDVDIVDAVILAFCGVLKEETL